MVLPQELADLRHAIVLTACIEGRTGLFCIELHTAKLVNVERTTETTDALLLENSRATVFTLHGNVTNQEQG